MRWILTWAIFVLMLGTLAACGDGSDNGGGDEATDPTSEEVEDNPTPVPEASPTEADEAMPTPEEQASPTAAPAPTPTEEMAATEPSEDNSEPTEHIVEMLDPYEFSPASITISAGDTITWVNASSGVHTATGDPELAQDPENAILPDGAEAWDSGNLDPGEEFSYTFDVPGEYTYFCIPHEVLDMVGAITVEE